MKVEVATPASSEVSERPIETVRGTRDWLPGDFARIATLEALLLDRFARAGYEQLQTPVLEPTDLHERKSGAGIVSKLFELSAGSAGPAGVCLRPELTAGIVRAYTASEIPQVLPWRVSHSGPVFRYETPRPGRLREFRQVGVERIGGNGPVADGEVIWLADWALREAGVKGATIRIGHVGLILEMLERSGLPAPLANALIEMLSEAAADGQGVHTLENGLEQLTGWLKTGDAGEIPREVDRADDQGIDRLFRTLVPVVTGRRSGHEIIHRLRRKWDLGHGLLAALEGVRQHVHDLAELKGKPDDVLDRLGSVGESLAPESVASLRALLSMLESYGIARDRIELDLGFGRGIGFYSQMIFELIAPTPEGPVEICGGGRYDGLARVLGSDRDDRGVGFAFGLERLAGVLDSQGISPASIEPRGFLIQAYESGCVPNAVALASRLREEGCRAVLEVDFGLDEAIAQAEVSGMARVVQVRGPEDYILHDLVTLTEVKCGVAEIDKLARQESGGTPPMTLGTESAPVAPIRIALPSKGHLYDGIVEILKTAGYKVRRASDRQYEATIAGHPRFHVVFMRPSDIVTQVEEGRCQLGITGMDVYAERAAEAARTIVVTPDLGYGGCRLVVAVPESWIDVGHIIDLVDLTSEFKAAGKTFRVSTKYPNLTQAHFRRWGIYYYQIIDSEGALELHPSLGIADIIVDLTSSGTTLKDNRLREIDQGTVLSSSSCLIGNAPSLRTLANEGVTGPLGLLLDAIDGVRASEGMLHLEVVGSPAEPGTETAAAVADYLRDQGAQHLARGEVWDDNGRPGWRVTALVAANRLTACQRRLFQLGASRVVGLPARFVFGRDSHSTFDDLRLSLAEPPQK